MSTERDIIGAAALSSLLIGDGYYRLTHCARGRKPYTKTTIRSSTNNLLIFIPTKTSKSASSLRP